MISQLQGEYCNIMQIFLEIIRTPTDDRGMMKMIRISVKHRSKVETAYLTLKIEVIFILDKVSVSDHGA